MFTQKKDLRFYMHWQVTCEMFSLKHSNHDPCWQKWYLRFHLTQIGHSNVKKTFFNQRIVHQGFYGSRLATFLRIKVLYSACVNILSIFINILFEMKDKLFPFKKFIKIKETHWLINLLVEKKLMWWIEKYNNDTYHLICSPKYTFAKRNENSLLTGFNIGNRNQYSIVLF